MTDGGEAYPVGSGSKRFYPEPTSLKQAKARVHEQMAHLEANCRDRIDIGYATEMLTEAFDDYVTWVQDNIGVEPEPQ